MRHVLLLGSASLASSTIPVLVDSSLRWGVVFVFAVIASVVLCRASAAVRHIAWMFSLSALLLMPILVVLLPDWRVLPWKSSDSMATLASHGPTTDTVDANVSLAQSVDSTELDSTIHPLMLEVVNDKSDDRGTTISNLGQIPKRVDGWLTLVDKLGLLWIVGVVICMMRLIAGRLVVRQLASGADQAAADPLMRLGDLVSNASELATIWCSVRGSRHRLTQNSCWRLFRVLVPLNDCHALHWRWLNKADWIRGSPRFWIREQHERR